MKCLPAVIRYWRVKAQLCITLFIAVALIFNIALYLFIFRKNRITLCY